jgi:hypothetical protein
MGNANIFGSELIFRYQYRIEPGLFGIAYFLLKDVKFSKSVL